MTLYQKEEGALVTVTRAQKKKQLAAVKETEEGEISTQSHPLLPLELSSKNEEQSTDGQSIDLGSEFHDDIFSGGQDQNSADSKSKTCREATTC